MRQTVICSLVLWGLACFVSPPVLAEIAHTLAFEYSRVSFETRESFDVLRVEGCMFDLDPGKPMVPVRCVHFSIPPGMRATGVEVRSIEQVEIKGHFYLYPAQPPVKLSSEEVPEFIGPDAAVYEAEGPYPQAVARIVTNGNMGGYAVAGVKVYPLEYRPREGKVLLNSQVDLALVLEPSKEPARFIAGRTEGGERAVADRVRALVANPESVAEHVGLRAKGIRQGTVEYAVVTVPKLVDEFQPLADWKTKKGVRAGIFTTDWIYGNYSGTDEQEKIRNFIKDYEANHGLVYVLIGGGAYKVPARTAWDDLGYDAIRAELYYSDTDGSWNADGDTYYGEHPADDVDMYGDVYVGRARPELWKSHRLREQDPDLRGG